MLVRHWGLTILVSVFCGACNDTTPPSVEVDLQALPEATAAGTSLTGMLEFTLGESEHSFEYLPDTANFHSALASAVSAKPAIDAPEEITINFLYADIKALEYPVVLRNNTGFIYIDAEGTEWAGPGQITLESYTVDGKLMGSFTNVSLPHTDKTLQNIVLNDGRLEVQLGRR